MTFMKLWIGIQVWLLAQVDLLLFSKLKLILTTVSSGMLEREAKYEKVNDLLQVMQCSGVL